MPANSTSDTPEDSMAIPDDTVEISGVSRRKALGLAAAATAGVAYVAPSILTMPAAAAQTGNPPPPPPLPQPNIVGNPGFITP